MAYTPTVWATGDIITAEKLNKMENGISDMGAFFIQCGGTTQADADQAMSTGKLNFNKTWTEINNAYKSGKKCLIILNPYMEATLGNTLNAEIIGMTGGGGVIDSKYSAALYFGAPENTPRFALARADAADGYPVLSLT